MRHAGARKLAICGRQAWRIPGEPGRFIKDSLTFLAFANALRFVSGMGWWKAQLEINAILGGRYRVSFPESEPPHNPFGSELRPATPPPTMATLSRELAESQQANNGTGRPQNLISSDFFALCHRRLPSVTIE